MVELVKISDGEEPSTDTNHVLVEQTAATTFRGAGTANHDGEKDFFAPPQTRELDAMLKAAIAWADAHGIRQIHVKMQVAH